MLVTFLEVYLLVGLVLLAGMLLFAGLARRRIRERHEAMVKKTAEWVRPELREWWCAPEPLWDRVFPWLVGVPFIVIVWPWVIAFLGWRLFKRLRKALGFVEPLPPSQQQFSITPEHLLEELSLEEIERIEIVNDPLGAAPALPFGFLNVRWREFVAARSPDTELWRFQADGVGEYFQWKKVSGYAAVRDEAVERYFVAGLSDTCPDP